MVDGEWPTVTDERSTAEADQVVCSQRSTADGRSATFWAACILVLVTLAAFANSFRGDFVYDDLLAIVGNSSIHSLWPLAGVLSPPIDGATVAGRPLLNLSFALNYHFGGENPWGYHLANLVIHVLAALLLFGVLRRSFRLPALCDRFGRAATPLALAIALVWAIHPLQTESVTYVAQRAESGFGLFYLLVLYCVIRGAEKQEGEKERRGEGEKHTTTPLARLPLSFSPPLPFFSVLWYAAAVLVCLLGMAWKEALISVPLFVLLYDRTLLSGSLGQSLWRRWGLYLGLLATEGLLLYLVFSMSLAASHQRPGVTAWTYACAQPRTILHYLRLCFWPRPLCLDAWPPLVTSFHEILPGLVVLGALLAATLAGLLRRRSWALLGAWFFLILAPSSSIVPLWQLSAEHRMYLPLAAVATTVVLAAHGVYRLLGRGNPMVARSAAVALGAALVTSSVALACGTLLRNEDYRDLRIWQDTVAKAPWNPEAQFMVGARLGLAGKTAEAISHLEKAVALKPWHVHAHDDLAILLEKQGRTAEAMFHWSAALRYDPRNVSANYNYALALQRQGRLAEALVHYERAIAADPRNAAAHEAAAEMLQRQGNLASAADHYRKALEIEPDAADLHNNLGGLLFQQQKIGEAVAQFERAAAIDPKNVAAQINLGNAWVQSARPRQAIACFQRALQVDPHSAEAQLGLAAALGGLGETRESLAHYQQAIAANPRLATAHIALAEMLQRQGEIPAAVAHYRKALEIEPEAADLHNALGALFAQQRKFDDAMAHFERAAAIDPKNVAAQINLGAAFVQLDRPERAIPYFEKALAIDPHCAEAHSALASALHGLGRVRESIAHWRQALQSRPQDPEARRKLGLALFEIGQVQDGQAQFRALEQMQKNGAR
jgi:tetratricopeptide (TPR) repeat protein